MSEIKQRNNKIEYCINQMALGNINAMDDLYMLIKSDILAYALSKSLPKDDALDIMQDTFMQIYKYAKTYNSKNKPMAWIITIENSLINRYYQLKSREAKIDDDILENKADDNNIVDKFINNRLVKELLSLLDEDEKQIIILHIVSNLKFREIAKLLNKPISTILSKYNRAIKYLQEKRGDLGEE